MRRFVSVSVVVAMMLFATFASGGEGPAATKPAGATLPADIRSLAATTRVSASCPAALKRGLNLGGWFAQYAPSTERYTKHITAEDAARIKDLGCTFVRLPIDPAALIDPKKADAFNAANLKILDNAISMFQDAGLAVIVCPYLEGEPKGRIINEAKTTDAFLGFWSILGRHLAKRPVDKTFLQVMNEPATDDQKLWDKVQAQIIAEMRAAAPKNTIIASANMRWGGGGNAIGGLVAGRPVADKNVVYDFHFYDPVQFTHQGAGWMQKELHGYKLLPYPSSPENIRPLLAAMTDDGARAFAEMYGREKWNRERIDERIAIAVLWAQVHKVPILCGEFGAYKAHAEEADRMAYLKDVREVLESHGIPWAMWDYLGDFGIVLEKDGNRSVDNKVAAALGLSTTKPAE